MRKILAILLAMLLMLLGCTALAERDAAVLTLDNLKAQTDGQSASVDGLTGYLVLQNVNDLPSIALLIDGDSEPLFTAVLQMNSKQVFFAIDGMDHGYVIDIPADQADKLAQFGDAGMSMVIPMLAPALDQLVLPPFTGVDVPKVDMTTVLSGYMNGSDTFEIPYEQVNELLDQLLNMAKEQGRGIENLDQAIEGLEQMKAAGMGVAIKGTIDDNGSEQKVTGGLYLAFNGIVTDQQLAEVTVDSTLNSFEAALNVPGTGEVMTVSLVSDPAAARLDFNVNVADAANLAFGLFSEDGLQKAALDINAAADKAYLEFCYGQQNGTDVVAFRGEAGGAAIDLTIDTAMGADGVRTGTLSINAVQEGQTIVMTGDITMYVGDAIDLSSFTMPTDLRSFDELTGEDISAAFAPVGEYINTHTTMG